MLRKSVVVLSIILWGLTAQIDPAVAEQPAASESQASAASIEISVADTLSGIAARIRLDESVSIQQVMLAIQATNPDAFIGGNINRMRSDVVLQAPSLQEIKSIDAELAFYEVARQNREVSSIQLDRRIAELENQLALRLDEANRIRLEREGMDSRLMVLETEIGAAQEVLRLRDQQLAQLQGSVAEIARLAEQEAVLAAAETAAIVAESAEALQSEGQEVRLVNDIRHIFTNNPLIMSFGILLLILVIVMRLRRKKSENLVDETINDIANEELQSAGDGVEVKAKEESKKAAEVAREQSSEEKPEREMEDDRSFERDDNDHDKSVRLSDSDSGDGIKKESVKKESLKASNEELEIQPASKLAPDGKEDLEKVIEKEVEGDDLDFLLDSNEGEESEDIELLSDHDEAATKLELAYAYQKMGDIEGAREILQEVIEEGTKEQVKEAENSLASLDNSYD